MKIKQETFERIVGDAVTLLNEKHQHVQTITGGADPVPFQLGLATTADALLQALALNGIEVAGDEDQIDSVVTYLRRHQDRLGVEIEIGDDAIHLVRASQGGSPAQQ